MNNFQRGKMTKKKSNEAPQVSNLPIPISDTPIVIDLPDGQKLVLGRLGDGTVIEVATWHGVGRPDSRTNRLMIGMSTAAAQIQSPTVEVPTKNETIDAPAGQKIYAKWGLSLVKGSRKILSKTLNSTKIPKVGRLSPSKVTTFNPISKVSRLSTSHKSEEIDVEAWLDSVVAKSKVKAAKQESAKVKKSSTAAKALPTKKSTRKKLK